MKILVTGGAGFIGSHLTCELVRRGHAVRVIDNLVTGYRQNLAEVIGDVEFFTGSIADADLAARAVASCDVVLHQAALPSVARSLQDPVGANEANVTGTITLLTAARDAGVRKFVYAGSSSAYGDNPELPKREDMASLPRSPYAVAKLAGEQYCKVFGRLFPMETICFRYFNVFGPRQNPSSRYAAVIPAFIRSMLEGRPLRIDGDGTQSRDFTFVGNVVRANLCAVEAEGVTGEVFNIGCGHRYDLNFLVSELAAILGVEPEVHHSDPRAGDVPHSLADISKAGRMLGYTPAIDFREGLRRTVDWFRAEGDRHFALCAAGACEPGGLSPVLRV